MTRQIATFKLQGMLFGLDILLVKEVYRNMSITPVPDAPAHLQGLMNLRGRVVTVVDLNVCLERPAFDCLDDLRLLILKTNDEIRHLKYADKLSDMDLGEDIVGFLINRMDDVIDVADDEVLSPPPNLEEMAEELIEGVVKRGDRLIILLSVMKVLDRVVSVSAETES
jgi:purine-binding chemotaxis protein CheW